MTFLTAQLLGVATLNLLAFGVSGLVLHKTKGARGLPGCGAGSGCDSVVKSRWSRWGPWPVLAGGAVTYAVGAMGAVLALVVPAARRAAWDILTAQALLAMGASVWLLVVAALILRRFCLYCGVINMLAGSAALLVLGQTRPWLGSALATPLLVGGTLLVMLIAGQCLLSPKQYQMTITNASVKEPPQAIASDFAADVAPGSSTSTRPSGASLPQRHRRLRLYGGRVSMDATEWPILGIIEAPHLVAWLFDHTCHQCHLQHPLLAEVIARFEGQLAIAAIPIPMHPACNPVMTCKPDPRSAQACAYARLTLALWQARSDRYEEWDRFMRQSPDIQPLGLALREASTLAPAADFSQLESRPELDRRIAAAIEIYRSAQVQTLPAILLPGGILQGKVTTSGELFQILQQHLAVDAKPLRAPIS